MVGSDLLNKLPKLEQLSELAKETHEVSKSRGWWDKPRTVKTLFALMNSEIGEATNGYRESLMDDKLLHRLMEEVELADVLLRVMDYGENARLELIPDLCHYPDYYIEKKDNLDRTWDLTCKLVDFYVIRTNTHYTMLVMQILLTGLARGYDVYGAALEKMEFNKSRKDHDPKTRTKKL